MLSSGKHHLPNLAHCVERLPYKTEKELTRFLELWVINSHLDEAVKCLHQGFSQMFCAA